MAMRLVLDAPGTGINGCAALSKVDPHLLALLRKANDWAQKWLSGSHEATAALALEEGVTPSYLVRVMYLAFLDPWIVQEITRGKQPPLLTAKSLATLGSLPIDWTEQRQALGWEVQA